MFFLILLTLFWLYVAIVGTVASVHLVRDGFRRLGQKFPNPENDPRHWIGKAKRTRLTIEECTRRYFSV